jgi:predicted TIM-barrel fold metal-dependent hydrolase
LLVDSHVHVFPDLGQANGYETVREHMTFAQSLMFHRSVGRRLSDNSLVVGREWHQGETPDDLNFRGGDYGKFLWTVDGVDYARYYLPPTARQLDSPPEQIIAQMDYLGVNKGVIQGGHTYGRLNEYLGGVVKQYPERLYALASIREWMADDPAVIAELRSAIEVQGLHGLFFDTAGIHREGRTEMSDDPVFDGFWGVVRELGIPVFWNITSASSDSGAWMEQHAAFGRWLKRHPDVACVYTHGIPLYRFWSGGKLSIPDEIWDALRAPNVHTEILIPILMGGLWDYPYTEVTALIREYHNRLGAEKLLWGSDMPNVERHCTYTQSLEYLTRYCDFLPQSALDRICGENVLSLL